MAYSSDATTMLSRSVRVTNSDGKSDVERIRTVVKAGVSAALDLFSVQSIKCL